MTFETRTLTFYAMHVEDQPIVRRRRECNKSKGAAVQHKYTGRAQDESGSQELVLHPEHREVTETWWPDESVFA